MTQQNPLVALAQSLQDKGVLDDELKTLLQSLSEHLVEFGERPGSIQDMKTARAALRNAVNKLKSGRYNIAEVIEHLEELAEGAAWVDGDIDIEDDLGNPKHKMRVSAPFLEKLMHHLGQGVTNSQDVETALVNAIRIRDAIVARRAIGQEPTTDLRERYDNSLLLLKNTLIEHFDRLTTGTNTP